MPLSLKTFFQLIDRKLALLVILFFTLQGFVRLADASHIRAGEIIAEVTDVTSRGYRFTFIGYRDTDTGVTFGGGVFDFGDGSVETDFIITETQLASNIVRSEFTVFHAYAAPGTYVVSYQEENRNEGIANMLNSLNTPFYVETQISIDPIYGFNRSPILTVPPIDDGMVGVSFIHNAGAFDPDGDSLAYRLTIPKQARGANVAGYMLPNDPFFYDNFAMGSESQNPPTFGIDPISGTLTWDAPGDYLNLTGRNCPEGVENCAEYNVAFVIEEWRQRFGTYELVGTVTRDMQIIITEGDNRRPELILPEAVCVEAGTTVEATVTGVDPDGHEVKLEAFGGPFQVFSPAEVSPDPAEFMPTPARLDFSWETNCGHVRLRPYEVQFKATDDPFEQGVRVGPSLADIDTWEITVVGPSPEWLSVRAGASGAISLNWRSYACDNAEEIQVWRRVGEYPFVPDDCEVGIPPNAGYQLVGSAGIDTTQFLDDNAGAGLAPGANYCYRLVAIFPAPGGGVSYASEEVCLSMQADRPVITHVDVAETGEMGEIIVSWTPPYDIDPDQFRPPYTYSLFRSNDLVFVEPEVQLASRISDTTFIDTGVNTLQRGYSYRVEVEDRDGTVVGSSVEASSVRLEVSPQVAGIDLQWRAVVPWSNSLPSYPSHYIYRDNVGDDPGAMVLIDSVQAFTAGFRYFDEGTFNNSPLNTNVAYCYYVETQGAYDNSPLIPEPLLNRSQVLCTELRDVVPPCAPIALSVADQDCQEVNARSVCDFDDFENRVEWQVDPGSNCDDDIQSFNVYFSATGDDGPFDLVGNTVDNFFIHEGLSSYKGCYQVSAVDRSGNESVLTVPACRDNCPNYQLPNVFTPNQDGVNDVFTPFYSDPSSPIADFDLGSCPRFVRGVVFTVFDRTGKTVFNYNSRDSESGILIQWNGKTNEGRDLPAGVYYYSADVEFDVLDKQGSSQELVGWVQVLR